MTPVLNKITAKWAGRCAASGKQFAAGDVILHDPLSRRCYLPGSEPKGYLVVEPVGGVQSPAYKAGWDAGAPGAPMTACPHKTGTAEAKDWSAGLRDRHRSGT